MRKNIFTGKKVLLSGRIDMGEHDEEMELMYGGRWVKWNRPKMAYILEQQFGSAVQEWPDDETSIAVLGGGCSRKVLQELDRRMAAGQSVRFLPMYDLIRRVERLMEPIDLVFRTKLL